MAKKQENNRFTDMEGSVFTKKDGSQYEFRNGKLVCIKKARKK